MAKNSKPKTDEVEEKEFGLKEIELQVISGLQQSYFKDLSMFLSFVSIDRLGYRVTDQTRFRVEDGKVYIKEEPAPEAPAKPKEEVSVG